MDNIQKPLTEIFPIYRQGDPRWSDDHYGYANAGADSTLGLYGCGLTCLAMLITFYGLPITPRELNHDLRTRGGFRRDTSFNLIDWPKLVALYPNIFKSYERRNFYASDPQPVDMQAMRESLGLGLPVILKVDGIPSTGKLDEHFVVAVSSLEESTLVADPYSGQIKPLSAFFSKTKPSRQNEPAAIWSMIFYEPRLS